MKKKIEEAKYVINSKLTKLSDKIQSAEDGFVGCLVVLGIVVVSYAAGYRSGAKTK